jgi:hypothetical protein
MTAMTTPLIATREALHQIAEHVVAAAQYAETGRIRLQYVPGGFQTTQVLDGNRRIAVLEGRLVVSDGGAVRSAPITTVRAAAEFVGISPGLPPAAYRAATPLVPDAVLAVDADSARRLAAWYGVGDAALRVFAAGVHAAAAEPVLWPEHFDLGITVDEVNYGVSPGDDQVPAPYLYVGPHSGPPRRDRFWNTNFGAARTIDAIGSVDDAVAFFREGSAAVAAGPDPD